MNPALENVAMTLGRPVGAFPEQDHIAHFLSHITYAKDPIFGANPIVAPQFIPACLEHLKQHLTLWYLAQADAYTSAALGVPYDALKVQAIPQEAQKLLAAALQHVHQDATEKLGEVGQGIQQMMQMLRTIQQQQPLPPTDPNIMAQVNALTQTATAETKRKEALDAARLQLDAQKQNQDGELKEAQIVSDQQIEAAKMTHNINTLTIESQFEAGQAEVERQHALQQAAQEQVQQSQQSAQEAQQAGMQQQIAAQAEAAQPAVPQPTQGV